MYKTRIGISVGLFAAGLYFMGLLGLFPMVLIAGYALLFEENAWLRRAAIKAVAVVVGFMVLNAMIGLLGNSASLIGDFFNLFSRHFNMMRFISFISILRNIVSIAQVLVLLLLGFKAIKHNDINIGLIDNTINRHM